MSDKNRLETLAEEILTGKFPNAAKLDWFIPIVSAMLDFHSKALESSSDVEKIYLWDTINGDDHLEEFDTIKECEKYVKECFTDTLDGVHPDIESLNIYKKVGGVYVEETGNYCTHNNEEVPIVKVKVLFDNGYKAKQSSAIVESEEKVLLKVEFKDHNKVVLTNNTGDTYTSKSEELMDFLHGASKGVSAIENDNEPEDKLYEFAKFMNQWHLESEQWNDAALKNIVSDYLASRGNPQPSKPVASHSCTVDNSIEHNVTDFLTQKFPQDYKHENDVVTFYKLKAVIGDVIYTGLHKKMCKEQIMEFLAYICHSYKLRGIYTDTQLFYTYSTKARELLELLNSDKNDERNATQHKPNQGTDLSNKNNSNHQ